MGWVTREEKGTQRLYDGEAGDELPLEKRGIGSKSQKRRETTLGNGRNMVEKDGSVKITHYPEDWPQHYWWRMNHVSEKVIYILKDLPHLVKRIDRRASNLIAGSSLTSTNQQWYLSEEGHIFHVANYYCIHGACLSLKHISSYVLFIRGDKATEASASLPSPQDPAGGHTPSMVHCFKAALLQWPYLSLHDFKCNMQNVGAKFCLLYFVLQ